MKTKDTPAAQPLASKNDLRWLVLASTGGATLAAITDADAATVQINLIGNQVTSAGKNLDADFTGDGTDDVSIVTSFILPYSVGAQFTTSGGPRRAVAFYNTIHTEYAAIIAGGFTTGAGPQSLDGLLSVSFTDSSINGGSTTNGWLDIHAFNTSTAFHSVVLTRLVFDDASTTAPTGVVAGGSDTVIGSTENGVFSPIPEPSRLALLTLGAGGILARRRRKKGAAG